MKREKEKTSEAVSLAKTAGENLAEGLAAGIAEKKMPTIEPRRKHALRRMEELFRAIVTVERADDVPDRDWAEEFHDLWTEYYFTHWGDTE